MSVYVGIDVHRKRSQVAVIDDGGAVLANRNVPNGVNPVLGVIGGLPPGTPAAFEAAFGRGWLVQLLEDYGFAPHLVHPLQCKAIASARLKNDKVDAAILAQLLRADLLPEAWIAPPAARQLRAAAAAPHPAAAAADAAAQPDPRGAGRPRSRPAGRLLERPWPRLARIAGPAPGLPGSDRGRPGPDRRPGRADRPARRRSAPARRTRARCPRPHPAARRRPVHRDGHSRRDR